ncbi:hypothetical protein CHS0354_039091 [Potamilus streckersoni]|uniref:THD domain-containing protein n=1 Tax=Potamilus streckersoni TaxID=2493646 RepID=A0AAE0TJG6_9BIVA|nr:hypothetical protein CHS0354_039091 [Potamilus streckersoni]
MNHDTKYSSDSYIREREHAYMKLFITAFIINLILTATLSVIVYYWKCQVSIFTEQNEEHQRFCLNCESLSVHPNEDYTLLKDFERIDNSTKCCAKNTLEVKYLVNQFLERNHRISKARDELFIPRCSSDAIAEKPAGRVIGVDLAKTVMDNNEKQVLRWLNTEEGSYQTPGVTFVDGQLEITTSGYYWFNSRIIFRDTNTTFADDNFAFFYTIYRRLADYPLREDLKLVEAGTTRCKLRSGFTDRSIFVGDIAYIRKGERIIAKASNPEIISLAPHASFLEVRLY